MLQSQNPPSVRSSDSVAEPAASAETFQSVLEFIQRQYTVIAFAAAIMLAMGLIYVFTTPSRYTATATMLIDNQKISLFQQQTMFNDSPVDTSAVDSQVEIIKSESIALAVIKQLHLTEDSEFVGSGGGLIGTLLSSVTGLFASNGPGSEFALTRNAVRAFQNQLSVRRVGLTYVIEIGFTSLSPDRAAQIANAAANAYIEDQLEAKYQSARRAGTWLQDRLRELREQASTAQRAVADYKNKNDMVDAGGRTINEQQLAELNSELLLARSQTAQAQAKIDRAQAVLTSNSPEAAVIATVTDTLKNDVITKLRSQYLDMSAREADWSARYGVNHLAVVNLRNQMREIQNSIRNELQRIAETYKSDLEIAKQHEDSVQQQLNQAVSQSQVTNQAQVSLRELESSAQTYQALYDNFLQRYMESVQQQSFPITQARVISAATRPLSKSRPRTQLVLALAGMIGLAFGVAVGAWRELADRVFRTSKQIESLLQTDCLALIPMVKQEDSPEADVGGGIKRFSLGGIPKIAPGMLHDRFDQVSQMFRGMARHGVQTSDVGVRGPDIQVAKNVKVADTRPQSIAFEAGVFSAIVEAPFSAFAEAIRSVKIAIDLSPTGSGGKVIGFTSSVPNEGKSSTAAAVARLAAQTGAKTLLVDCDLRNPTLSRSFSPKATCGWLEVVRGQSPIEKALWTDHVTNMRFLPAAMKSRTANSSEFLASEDTRKFFDILRRSFDYIIVDFPPVMPIVDVRASTDLVDAYVYVVEWGRTRIDFVERALHSASGVYERILGVVLTKVNLASLGRYDGRGSDYYNHGHYHRYGYTE
jgi:polysaccharide biosynthesis transport protein